MRDALAPVLQLSAALASGKPGREAQAATSSAQQGVLYTLRRVGKLLWSCLAPTAALEASSQLLEELGSLLVQNVLERKVSHEWAELVQISSKCTCYIVPVDTS